MASKRDPILVTMSNEYVLAYAEGAEVTANNKWPKEIKLLSFQMTTKPLLDPAIHKYPPDQQAREKLFRHITQYHNRSPWKEERLCPQLYLDCEISDDQHNIVLKISTKDITIGAIMGLSGGNADRKQRACCKLNLVDADINNWSCVMNLPEHLMLTK